MRNQFPGKCYRCGGNVAPGQGHFERSNGGWRTQHAECAIKYQGTDKKVDQSRQQSNPEESDMPKLSDADRGVLLEILLASGADEEWHTGWMEARPEAAYAMLATARRLITAEILAASGQPPIARLAAENARLREALGWFLNDPRFVVTVGGNPVAVEAMLTAARAALGEKP